MKGSEKKNKKIYFFKFKLNLRKNSSTFAKETLKFSSQKSYTVFLINYTERTFLKPDL